MKSQLIRRGVVLALVAALAFVGWMLFERLWRDDERPVTLLSERVTLGPKPLVIHTPQDTDADGSSLWLTVYLTGKKMCEGSEWAKEEAKRLPAIRAVAVTSDGQRHPMIADPCCASNVCGALKLHGAAPHYERQRLLVRVELSAPESMLIEKVTWRTGGMQPVLLGR